MMHYLVILQQGFTIAFEDEPSKPAATKTVAFNPEEDTARLTSNGTSKNAKQLDEESLKPIPFKDLIKLNLPDWFLVIPGIICAAGIGIMFPLMAVLFSGFLEVMDCERMCITMLYLEFQIFGSPDRDALMIGARNYGLGFIGLAIVSFLLMFISVSLR